MLQGMALLNYTGGLSTLLLPKDAIGKLILIDSMFLFDYYMSGGGPRSLISVVSMLRLFLICLLPKRRGRSRL
jgi:hypothetical protein